MEEKNLTKKIDQVLKVLSSVQEEVREIRNNQKEHSNQSDKSHEEILESIQELRASANTTDNMLEQHPLERIERLEVHNRLPRFVASASGDE